MSQQILIVVGVPASTIVVVPLPSPAVFFSQTMDEILGEQKNHVNDIENAVLNEGEETRTPLCSKSRRFSTLPHLESMVVLPTGPGSIEGFGESFKSMPNSGMNQYSVNITVFWLQWYNFQPPARWNNFAPPFTEQPYAQLCVAVNC